MTRRAVVTLAVVDQIAGVLYVATRNYVIKCHLQITFARAPQLATMDEQPTSNIAPSAPMVKLNTLPA